MFVDSSRRAYGNGSGHEQRYQSAAPMLAEVRELVVVGERMPPPARERQLGGSELRRRLVAP